MSYIPKTVIVTIICFALVISLELRKTIAAPQSESIPNCEDTMYVFENQKVSYLGHGAYLLKTWATCINGCHTPRIDPQSGRYQAERGRFDTDRPGAGGYKMHRSDGTCVMTPNITPDIETGLGAWSLDEIMKAIAECESKDGHKIRPPMICENLAKYARWQDVRAVACFVKYGLQPVKNDVKKLAQENDCTPAR